MTWQEFFRTRMPYISGLLNTEAVKRYGCPLPGFSMTKLVFWADETKFCWMVDEDELKRNFEYLITVPMSKLRALGTEIRTDHSRFVEFMDRQLETDRKSCSMPELKQILLNCLSLAYPLIGKNFLTIDAFDTFSTFSIKRLVRNRVGQKWSDKELDEKITELTKPLFATYALEEENEILRAASAVKQRTGPEAEKQLQQAAHYLRKKYWWAQLGWEPAQARTPDDFVELIRQAMKSSVRELEERTRLFDTKIRDQTNIRNRLIAEHGLEDARHLLELVDWTASLLDIRKQSQLMATWLTYRIIEQTGQKTNLPFELVSQATPSELIAILDGKPATQAQWKARKKAYFYGFLSGKEEYLGGSKARSRIRDVSVTPEKVADFQGLIANKGVTAGIVRICFGGQDAQQKVQKGDILVTGMTTPDFVPAMKRAGAIVTDEGGMTCHAAIISRELNIPCVVGTRIATKILHDGERVEVNANHGRIKRLQAIES